MLVIFALTQGPGHQPDKSAWEWKYTCATITKVSDFIKKVSITLTSATEQMWTTWQKNIGRGAAVLCRKYCFPCRRKQPTFLDATTGFPAKWRLRNERRNSILMTRHYSAPLSASDWLKRISHTAQPIRSTTQIKVESRHQYGISALVFVRRQFPGKPVLASRNVGCFLRLLLPQLSTNCHQNATRREPQNVKT